MNGEGFRRVQNVGDVACRHIPVNRNNDGTDSHEGKIGTDPFIRSFSDQGYWAVSPAAAYQLRADSAYMLAHLAERAVDLRLRRIFLIGKSDTIRVPFGDILDHDAKILEFCRLIKGIILFLHTVLPIKRVLCSSAQNIIP